MEVVPTDHECSCHLGGDDTTSENATTDGNISSERALLVCNVYEIHS